MNSVNCLIVNVTNVTQCEMEDPFELEPPVECFKLKLIGVVCVLLFVASLICNTSLLFIFIKYKDLRTPLNTFIIALTCLNEFGTIFELPWIIVSNLYCKWIFKKQGCVISAYFMYFIGCSSIYLMVAISIERFYIIYKPLSIRTSNVKTNLLIVAGCLCMGLLWPSFPLVGWSHYSLEGAYTSCSVEWKERSYNVRSYNLTIFGIVYAIPLILIIFTNTKLIMMVKSLPKKINSSQDIRVKKRVNSERNLTIIIVSLILTFILCWTPYALVAMYSVFINPDHVTPLLGTIPAIFAKSSMLWTSLIFVFSNKNIRHRFYDLILRKKPNSTSPNFIISRSKTPSKSLDKSLENLNQNQNGNV